MKVGSLVEKINNKLNSQARTFGYKTPIMGVIYTVREIKVKPRATMLLLEELTNPKILVKYLNGDIKLEEWGYDVNNFRELLPPIDILQQIEKSSEATQ